MASASPPSPPRRPGRPPRPDTATARANLLDLATQLFAAQGVAATTIANIAQRAGVTPAMLHYYFKSRDQLIDAVVLERIVPVIGYVWAPVPLEPGGPGGGPAADGPAAGGTPAAPLPDPASAARGFITEIVGRVVQSATDKPWLPSLWMHEVVNEGGQLRDRVLHHLPSDRLQAFAGLIAECQRRGAITPGVEPRLVFLSILGMTLLPLATSNLWRRIWQNDPVAQTIDNDAIARHAIAMLTGGLFAPTTPPTSSSSGR
ncbi:TetR/AcrR family transcriptional regulator [Achromobacter mucicolens]|uniref:TetR/AcrR family transcriptional regulator n=1 Tax=Achromobacter mucicolens TaxID=1389922 RepID=UPI0021D3861D|nr:helix-turn-helix domain-containing protein [Achromobacter mucicolens]MCU6616693.1 TetR/AcrR family transcriptional regulator [Achromobacter mucicolens]